MGNTLDLGRRIELQPMDKYCHNASLGLYQKSEAGKPQFIVHTYSTAEGVDQRVGFLTQALVVMLGLEKIDDATGWMKFPCGTVHLKALKRAFLDLCKLESGSPLEPKPLTVFDKKADGVLSVEKAGPGTYQAKSEKGDDTGKKRATALARGFAKICEMDQLADDVNQVAFPCKCDHDALIGMLMFRAQNVRASMQEEEMASSRGVLSAPSQQ